MVEIIAENNLDKTVWYNRAMECGTAFWILQKKEKNIWKDVESLKNGACKWAAPPPPAELKRGGIIESQWQMFKYWPYDFTDKPFELIEPGIYRFSLLYFLNCVDLAYPYKCDDPVKIYSNEFTIEEKQAYVSGGKESCEAQGGKWGPVGLSLENVCLLSTSDVGKECSDAKECEGTCMAELTEEQKNMLNKTDEPVYTKGQCSAVNIAVGCHAYVINGKVEGILCAD